MMCGMIDYFFATVMVILICLLLILIPPVAVWSWGITKFLLALGKDDK